MSYWCKLALTNKKESGTTNKKGEVDINTMRVSDLRKMLYEKGLDIDGSRKAMIATLREHSAWGEKKVFIWWVDISYSWRKCKVDKNPMPYLSYLFHANLGYLVLQLYYYTKYYIVTTSHNITTTEEKLLDCSFHKHNIRYYEHEPFFQTKWTTSGCTSTEGAIICSKSSILSTISTTNYSTTTTSSTLSLSYSSSYCSRSRWYCILLCVYDMGVYYIMCIRYITLFK